LKIGDLLEFGTPDVTKATFFSTGSNKRSGELYRHLRNQGPRFEDWSKSVERVWLEENTDLRRSYKWRLEALLLRCDFPPWDHVDCDFLKSLKPTPKKVWWTHGDLLMWIDQGLPINIMDRVGSHMKLNSAVELTQKGIQHFPWDSVLKEVDEDLKSKIKHYFNER
ncbi:hypothetical protein CROQUDRAFT_28447, partial [Cronartium quercuum f. sp. fusiforme G11]